MRRKRRWTRKKRKIFGCMWRWSQDRESGDSILLTRNGEEGVSVSLCPRPWHATQTHYCMRSLCKLVRVCNSPPCQAAETDYIRGAQPRSCSPANLPTLRPCSVPTPLQHSWFSLSRPVRDLLNITTRCVWLELRLKPARVVDFQ